jgi:7-carboxy-7-deazaguanine synthase
MYNEDVIYPIAETFVSPQGEGRNTGTLMQFIRFAGCTVGKPYKEHERPYKDDNPEDVLPIYYEKCTIWDGRSFTCDTDFRVKERKTAKELVDWALSHDVEVVLFTGGEPLMRDVTSLMYGLKQNGFKIHLETSGTIKPDLNQVFWKMFDWICVSPKKGFCDEYADLNIANEFKLLVDEHFDWRTVPDSIKRRSRKISLSPVNYTDALDEANMQRCVELQRQHTSVRLTQQSHKIWKVR